MSPAPQLGQEMQSEYAKNEVQFWHEMENIQRLARIFADIGLPVDRVHCRQSRVKNLARPIV